MKMNEFSTWRSEVETYWEDEIDDSSCSDSEKTSMKDSLTQYMDDLEDVYNNYLDKPESDMERFLEILYGYVSLRYKSKVDDENAPTISELITNDDIRTMFKLFTYDLISDYSTIFTINIDETTGACTLDTSTGYTDTETAISNAESEDNDEISNFRSSFPDAIRKSMIFRMYKQPPSKIEDIDIRCFTLNDLYLEEVLDSFNLSINGVNVNVDPC